MKRNYVILNQVTQQHSQYHSKWFSNFDSPVNHFCSTIIIKEICNKNGLFLIHWINVERAQYFSFGALRFSRAKNKSEIP